MNFKTIKRVEGIFDARDIPYYKTDPRRSGAIYTIKKKKKIFLFIQVLFIYSLHQPRMLVLSMHYERDSLECHQATQPCKRTMYIYLVLSFDFQCNVKSQITLLLINKSEIIIISSRKEYRIQNLYETFSQIFKVLL